MLDRIDMQSDGWFKRIRAGKRRKIPPGGRPSARWRPVLSDNFESSKLEGVDDGAGVLGSKWLFKDEHTELWSLTTYPGSITLLANETGIDSQFPRNMLLQKPSAAYYTLDTKVSLRGGCGGGNVGVHAGLVARELNSGSGGAVGLLCKEAGALPVVAFWQDTANILATQEMNSSTVYLKLDVDLFTSRGWWSYDNATWQGIPCANWPKGSPNWRLGDPVCAGSDIGSPTGGGTVLAWEAVHVDKLFGNPPSHGKPSIRGHGWAHSTGDYWAQEDSFTTMHPGIFAGKMSSAFSSSSSAPPAQSSPVSASFEFFQFTDNEVYASNVID
jgi:hypothetical protein